MKPIAIILAIVTCLLLFNVNVHLADQVRKHKSELRDTRELYQKLERDSLSLIQTEFDRGILFGSEAAIELYKETLQAGQYPYTNQVVDEIFRRAYQRRQSLQ